MSALPTEITAVRHGQSTANAAFALADATGALSVPITARDADLDLTPLGHAQAAALGHALADNPPDLVYCSPYRRTRRTLDEILAALSRAGAPLPQQIRFDERIRDRETGAWEMQTYSALRRDYPAEMARRDRIGPYYFRPPGGENLPDVALRVRSMLHDALPDAAGRRLLIVTHDAVVLVLRLILDQLEESVLADSLSDGGSVGTIGNCTVTRWSGVGAGPGAGHGAGDRATGDGLTGAGSSGSSGSAGSESLEASTTGSGLGTGMAMGSVGGRLRLIAFNDAEHLRVLDEGLARLER